MTAPPEFAKWFLATDAELSALRLWLESAYASLAPADAVAPVYIVFNHEFPANCRQKETGGMWGRDLDLFAREIIGNRWRGRGVGIMVDVGLCWTGGFSSYCEGNRPIEQHTTRWFTDHALEIVIHELAHELQVARPPRETDTRRPPAVAVHLVGEWLRHHAVNHDPQDGPGAACPYSGHGADFHRAALHLTARSRAVGQDVNVRHIIQSSFYGLSDTSAYVAALGDEPARMIDRPFSEIIATPPPAEFTALFKRDAAAAARNASNVR